MIATTNKQPKPLCGKLLRRCADGRVETLATNKPFGVLQTLKKNYIRTGIKKEDLKITY